MSAPNSTETVTWLLVAAGAYMGLTIFGGAIKDARQRRKARRAEVRLVRSLAAQFTAWHDVFGDDPVPLIPTEERS